MQELRAVIGEFPGLQIYGTHCDEIFDAAGRVDRYIALSEAARQVPEVPLYITYSLGRPDADRLRRLVAPFVDLVGVHGYSFEWWIVRGHSMAEYEAELRTTGKRAWFYHNERGTWFTPEWERIISGIYLWASPFAAHTPWAYRDVAGDPLDDTDGTHHDFVMSLPDPENPAELVSTRLWEAMRQGGEDLRYLATLERAIQDHGSERPGAAASARRDLDRLHRLVSEAGVGGLRAAVAKQAAPSSSIDLETPLAVAPPQPLRAEEAPIIHALAERFGGTKLDELRAMIASDISALV
jgi:hypothetical protein